MSNQVIQARTYEEKLNSLKKLVDQGANIYLYGNGGNGKSYVCKDLCKDEKYEIYNFECELVPHMLIKKVTPNKSFIIHSNLEPNEAIINSNCRLVEFLGKWTDETNEYI